MINQALIDTHLHLWDTTQMTYAWLDAFPAIQKTFLIDDYHKAIRDVAVQKIVFVQAECKPDQYLDEVCFVEEQQQKDPRIQGMVAYAPLEQGKAVKPILEILQQHVLVKGVRRMYDDEPTLLVDRDFIEGIRLLPEYGYSFDVSIKPPLMAETIKMITACPDTLFILDHLGKPNIRGHAIDEFKRNIDVLAGLPNVVAKLSGLITEADWTNWTLEALWPYVQHAVNCFGSDRLMFGGDWPVVLLAGSWYQWVRVLQTILADYPPGELHKIFFKNAISIYEL